MKDPTKRNKVKRDLYVRNKVKNIRNKVKRLRNKVKRVRNKVRKKVKKGMK